MEGRMAKATSSFDGDQGKQPSVIALQQITRANNAFRAAAWTGDHLQLTLMTIDVGDDIGMEVHDDHDQFLRIEAGAAEVQMGPNAKDVTTWQATTGDAIFVPAGTWHNISNSGQSPLKLYSIYAGPEHPHGTIHPTKADAEA